MHQFQCFRNYKKIMNNQNIIYLKKELIKINNHFREKKFNLVIKKSKLLLKTNLKQPMIYNLIGFSHLELGETEKALENFLLAIGVNLCQKIAKIGKKKFIEFSTPPKKT